MRCGLTASAGGGEEQSASRQSVRYAAQFHRRMHNFIASINYPLSCAICIGSSHQLSRSKQILFWHFQHTALPLTTCFSVTENWKVVSRCASISRLKFNSIDFSLLLSVAARYSWENFSAIIHDLHHRNTATQTLRSHSSTHRFAHAHTLKPEARTARKSIDRTCLSLVFHRPATVIQLHSTFPVQAAPFVYLFSPVFFQECSRTALRTESHNFFVEFYLSVVCKRFLTQTFDLADSFAFLALPVCALSFARVRTCSHETSYAWRFVQIDRCSNAIRRIRRLSTAN